MKKRAKQLAMLGLTVTMMCGTQMTAFASGLGEEAPVAIETEAKATANEETKEEVKTEAKEEKADAKEEVKTEVKEEVVTGTEVAETPVVEETEVKETVAGTEELVGLGVSTEAEAETEAQAEKEDAVEDAVPTTAPQADVEATTDTNTEVTEPEAEEQADAEVTAPTVSATVNTPVFDGTQDLVVTVKAEHDEECQISMDAFIPINGTAVPAKDMKHSDTEISITYGKEDVLDLIERLNLKDGDTLTIGTSKCWVEYDYTNGGEPKVVGIPDVYVTYSTGDTGNGGGTVTPEPEKPQPEPEKPQPEPEKPQPDGGNGGTETPDPEQPEKPDGGNGNGEGTQKPDGNEQKPDGNEQKPDGNEQKPDGNEQKPDDTQKPNNTQKPEEQKPVSGQQVQADNTTNKGNAPKTGDPTTALPFVGAGLSSLGVALGAFFKKRK